jgi:alkanesulfonate monooxygenase SsuD/methylene tetrahydromethanopterin reductase-like flavin-dependent oxidoreductase (luciferase family)
MDLDRLGEVQLDCVAPWTQHCADHREDQLMPDEGFGTARASEQAPETLCPCAIGGADGAATIARYKDAVAAMIACLPAYERDDVSEFSEAASYEDEVSLELALTPCATDAEFLEKLKYVLAREILYMASPTMATTKVRVFQWP